MQGVVCPPLTHHCLCSSLSCEASLTRCQNCVNLFLGDMPPSGWCQVSGPCLSFPAWLPWKIPITWGPLSQQSDSRMISII